MGYIKKSRVTSLNQRLSRLFRIFLNLSLGSSLWLVCCVLLLACTSGTASVRAPKLEAADGKYSGKHFWSSLPRRLETMHTRTEFYGDWRIIWSVDGDRWVSKGKDFYLSQNPLGVKLIGAWECSPEKSLAIPSKGFCFFDNDAALWFAKEPWQLPVRVEVPKALAEQMILLKRDELRAFTACSSELYFQDKTEQILKAKNWKALAEGALQTLSVRSQSFRCEDDGFHYLEWLGLKDKVDGSGGTSHKKLDEEAFDVVTVLQNSAQSALSKEGELFALVQEKDGYHFFRGELTQGKLDHSLVPTALNDRCALLAGNREPYILCNIEKDTARVSVSKIKLSIISIDEKAELEPMFEFETRTSVPVIARQNIKGQWLIVGGCHASPPDNLVEMHDSSSASSGSKASAKKKREAKLAPCKQPQVLSFDPKTGKEQQLLLAGLASHRDSVSLLLIDWLDESTIAIVAAIHPVGTNLDTASAIRLMRYSTKTHQYLEKDYAFSAPSNKMNTARRQFAMHDGHWVLPVEGGLVDLNMRDLSAELLSPEDRFAVGEAKQNSDNVAWGEMAHSSYWGNREFRFRPVLNEIRFEESDTSYLPLPISALSPQLEIADGLYQYFPEDGYEGQSIRTDGSSRRGSNHSRTFASITNKEGSPSDSLYVGQWDVDNDSCGGFACLSPHGIIETASDHRAGYEEGAAHMSDQKRPLSCRMPKKKALQAPTNPNVDALQSLRQEWIVQHQKNYPEGISGSFFEFMSWAGRPVKVNSCSDDDDDECESDERAVQGISHQTASQILSTELEPWRVWSSLLNIVGQSSIPSHLVKSSESFRLMLPWLMVDGHLTKHGMSLSLWWLKKAVKVNYCALPIEPQALCELQDGSKVPFESLFEIDRNLSEEHQIIQNLSKKVREDWLFKVADVHSTAKASYFSYLPKTGNTELGLQTARLDASPSRLRLCEEGESIGEELALFDPNSGMYLVDETTTQFVLLQWFLLNLKERPCILGAASMYQPADSADWFWFDKDKRKNTQGYYSELRCGSEDN